MIVECNIDADFYPAGSERRQEQLLKPICEDKDMEWREEKRREDENRDRRKSKEQRREKKVN